MNRHIVINDFPAEIERVLAAHPAVALAAVGKLPDEITGEISKAYIVLKTDATCTADEIVTFCHQSLAAYKCPRKVQFVEKCNSLMMCLKLAQARSCDGRFTR